MATPSLLGVTSAIGQILCVTRLSGTSATIVYTVPPGASVKVAAGALCNTTSSPATVSVSVVPSGGTAGATNQIISGFSLAANDTLPLGDYLAGVFLGDGDAIAVTASASNAVVVWLSGVVSSGASSGVGSTLVPTGVKTSAYTAVSGDLVRVSTASAAVTVTLPAAAAGTVIAVKLTAQSGSNSITVAPNGTDTIDGAASLTISTLQDVRTLLGLAGGWVVANGLATGGGSGAVSSVNTRTGAVTGLAEDSTVVHNTGAETVAGVKTFSSSPVVPTPSSSGQAATKGYVDSAAGGASFANGFFGDGSDGSATLDGTATVSWASKSGSVYTLTSSVHLDTLDISPGVTLRTVGFVLCVKTALTGSGTIAWNGSAATTAAAAPSAVSNYLYGSSNPAGAGTTAAGAAGTAQSGHICLGGAGGAGGAGSSGSGGAGGTQAAVTAAIGGLHAARRLPPCAQGYIVGNAVGTIYPFRGGNGGGGGGGDGTNSGGGGGGGGGTLVVNARAIAASLTVQSNGGNGFTPATGNCGGGGGGGGGTVIVNTTSVTGGASPTLQANGGSAGSGVGTGLAGTAGSTGLAVLNVFA